MMLIATRAKGSCMRIAWAPYQHRQIDWIATKAGIPKRTTQHFAADHILSRQRFSTPRLAAKLTQALRTRIP